MYFVLEYFDIIKLLRRKLKRIYRKFKTNFSIKKIKNTIIDF